MKAHSNEFKEELKQYGRQFDDIITYGNNTLGQVDINSVRLTYDTTLLKSQMKKLVVDSNVLIPKDTVINYKLGLKLRSGKNLFDINGSLYAGSITKYNNGFTLVKGSNRTLSIMLPQTLSAGTYTFSCSIVTNTLTDINKMNLDFRNSSGRVILQTLTQNGTFTFTASSSFDRLYAFISSTESDEATITLDNVQLELGSQATDYEEYGECDYLDYGNYIVKEVEEQKDKNSYLITCYDKMLLSMIDYEHLSVTYPITIRNYLNAICTKLGLTFANASDIFTNYDKEVSSEHYMSYNETTEEWQGLGYTFRDVLDDLAECVGGFIVINEDDELEIKYTQDTVGKNIIFDKNHTPGTSFDGMGVIYTLNNDGSISVNGTAHGNYNYYLMNNFTLKLQPGTYTLSGGINSNAWVRLFDGTNYYDTNVNNKKTFTITQATNFGVIIRVKDGTTVNGTFYPQLEKGSVVTQYEQHIETDTINEEYFNDKNVNIGEHYGPINVLVLSRAGVDNLIRPSGTLPQNPVELKIEDNPILEQENRETFIDGIYNNLNGLEFYLNNMQTKGVLYYELGDKYNVSLRDVTYPCLMLNDDINRTTGLKEYIYTNEPVKSVTEYKYASDTDRVKENARNAYIIANKAEGTIEQVVTSIGDDGVVTAASIVMAINNAGSSVEIIADHLKLEGYTTINGGFAVDQYGTVTITDGSIIMHDDPNTDTVPKIKIIDENKNYAYNEMWSDGIFISKDYRDSTSSLKHSETADFEISGVHGSGSAIDDLASYWWFGDTYEDINGKSVSNGLMANHFTYDDNGVKHYTEFSLIDNDDKIVMLSTGYNYFRDDVEIEGDLYNNALDKFDDTSGNDWQEMLRNKIDYCINNVNTSKWNGQYFINGGWSGVRYGFGIFSKIGDWRQLVWFSNMGIYYVAKDGNNNYQYDRVGKGINGEIQPSNDLNDFKTDGKYTYNRGDQYYANSPTNDGIHILNVTSNGGTDWVIQEDYVMRWGSSTTEKYIRMYSPPGWSNWQRII